MKINHKMGHGERMVDHPFRLFQQLYLKPEYFIQFLFSFTGNYECP